MSKKVSESILHGRNARPNFPHPSSNQSRLGQKYNIVLGRFGDPRAILKCHYGFMLRSAVQITELRPTDCRLQSM